MPRRYGRFISLGRHCQTAYQIRRFTGDETAFCFDWLRTPHRSLVQLLLSRFQGFFEKENLEIIEDGSNVIDTSNGICFRHTFSKNPDRHVIDQASIDQEYEGQREKMDFLIHRWAETLRSHPVLFVRQDTPSSAEILELYCALRSAAAAFPYGLLVVVPPTHTLSIAHPRIYVEQGGELPSGPTDWKGNHDLWDRILSKYWETPKPVAQVTAMGKAS